MYNLSIFYNLSISQSALQLQYCSIAGFHCQTVIETIQQLKSRIKEIKEDEYSNSLANLHICATPYLWDAMFVSLSGAQIWRPKAKENICNRVLL